MCHVGGQSLRLWFSELWVAKLRIAGFGHAGFQLLGVSEFGVLRAVIFGQFVRPEEVCILER